MITYKSRFLTRAEVWFDNAPPRAARPVDWILYHQRPQPLAGAKARGFYTLLIDLGQTEGELYSQLSDDTAYKIRRARDRDRITCEACDPRDPEVVNRFEQMYTAFATAKGLSPLNRPLMESLAAAGLLDLSVAKDAEGTALVYHANYRDANRATQLELPSLYPKFTDKARRNFISRANRYLTWTNILRYKEQKLRAFDFGGWHLGNDPAMLSINDFKRGFGGRVLREYQCEQILTLKGQVVLCAARLLGQAKSLKARRLAPVVSCEKSFPRVQPSVAME